jgi:hypothetical protein
MPLPLRSLKRTGRSLTVHYFLNRLFMILEGNSSLLPKEKTPISDKKFSIQLGEEP